MISSIYLSINYEKSQKDLVAQRVIDEAESRSILVTKNPKDAEAIISIGGDGTFLFSSHQALEYEKIVTGINLGRYGFLPSFGENEIKEMFDALSTDEFISEKSLLKVSTQGNETTVINEVVIERSRSDRAVRLEVKVFDEENDDIADVFVADGIIVATPTGSTAYSSSAGGPVLVDSTNSMVLNFVALHHPKIPPIVLGRDKKILIRNQEEAILACDGKCLLELDQGSEVLVSFSSKKLKVCENHPSILKRLLDKS